MARQALIDEGVIGVEQVEGAFVFAYDAAEEEFGFALQRLAQA